MEKHTLLGNDAIRKTEKILGKETFLNFAREIAKSHHEKWNGAGYPEGIKGDKIPLSARIMAIADAYDAMVTNRIYKRAIPHKGAVQIIHNDSGKHFDPFLAKIFEQNHSDFDEIAKQYKD